MADIFVSYASEDRAAAGSLVEALEREGHSVWWDQHLHVGTFFQRIINHELVTAKCIVVLWSTHSVRKDWVIGEALVGLDRGVMVPVQLEPCSLPVPFNAQHTFEFDPGSTSWTAVLSKVEQLLEAEPEAETSRADGSARYREDAARRTSVAVLPFEGGGASERDLGRVIAAETIDALSRFSTLRVVPRRSSFAAEYADASIDEICRGLDCTYVITGRLSLTAPRTRLVIELADGVWNRLISSTSYEESESELMDVGVTLARRVARQLGGEFLKSEVLEACGQPASRLDVWQLISSAKAHFVGYGVEALQRSMSLIDQALTIAPGEPQALALRASIAIEMMRSCVGEEAEAHRASAMRSAERALQEASHDPTVLKYCGSVYSFVGNPDGARLLRESVKNNPFDLGAWGYLADALINTGSADSLREGLSVLDMLLEESPQHPGAGFWHLHRATAYTLLDRMDEAVEAAEAALLAQPELTAARWVLINALGWLSANEQAAEALAGMDRRSQDFSAAHFERVVKQSSGDGEVAGRRLEGLRRLGLLP